MRLRLLAFLLSLVPVGFAAEPLVLPLWPEGVPQLRPDAAAEKVVNQRIVGVHYPSLTRYAPAPGSANGGAVIFCPGGGYVRLAIGQDGGDETRRLTEAGVAVFILKYRMVEYGHPAPLQDVLRAIRLLRHRAVDLDIDPTRIGVFGQSAGGHLAACAGIFWDAAEGRTGAELDATSARPDFVALVYPVITLLDPHAHRGSREALLGKAPAEGLVKRLSLEQQVRSDMPPVFLVAAQTDRSVPVENTLQFYSALRAAHVPAEMHVYAQGAHGNSLDPQYGPTAAWPERMIEWMRFNGWLAPRRP